MYWKLQDNAVTRVDLDILTDFINHTDRFTQFTKVKEFERAYASWQGCRHAVFVNSGSSANLILISALKTMQGWNPGDEVIVPSVTWPTTVTPVMQAGLTPVFVDANLQDLSVDYEQVAAKMTSRTRAIFVAHLLGFPADIARLRAIVGARPITIIEDCCESHGATADGVKVGNLGLAGTFSFYWGHHMTTVEGGMVCTNDEALYKMLVLKRSHGLARELPIDYHDEIRGRYPDHDFNFLFLTDGFNVRNTEFNAVLGLAQVASLDEFVRIRNQNYEAFAAMCADYPRELITIRSKGVSSFALPFLFYRRERKEAFQEEIRLAGIESRPLISGNLLRQPFLEQYYDPRAFPNADFLHSNAFYVGNNQFVGTGKLALLETLFRKFAGDD
jgi:CDP-6-deoxy-D-xylo-4-hexulose-3-dehydrase